MRNNYTPKDRFEKTQQGITSVLNHAEPGELRGSQLF
jgi:hypothetical protein